jgi:hypothetical protein
LRRLTTLAITASVAFVLLTACSDEDGGAASNASPLSDDVVRGLTFPSQVTSSGEAPLEDGSYQEAAGGGGASLASVTLADVARGDLDDDGDEDVVAVLVESGGGTGSFYGLWAVLNEEGEPAISGERIGLGDRIQVRGLTVGEDGVITLEATVGGPNDPLCCPTLEETQRYRFDGALVAVEP